MINTVILYMNMVSLKLAKVNIGIMIILNFLFASIAINAVSSGC